LGTSLNIVWHGIYSLSQWRWKGKMLVNAFFLLLPFSYETPEVFTTLEFLIPSKPNNFEPNTVYLNSFNPTKKINFDLIETDFVKLKVYNILGKEITTLINNEEMNPGSYTVVFNENGSSSGI